MKIHSECHRAAQVLERLYVIVGILGVLAAGCSKPASQSPTPASKVVVKWRTIEQGLITCEVRTNDFVEWSSSKEVLDPLEEAPEFADAFRDANAQAEAATVRWAGQMGRAQMYWKKKKEVLRDKYRIDWKSPADLNPMTSYD